MMKDDIDSEIAKLSEHYKSKQVIAEKDKAYEELLTMYKHATEEIARLKSDTNTGKLPSKSDIDSMSGMLDLINKLDVETIEKLNRLGGNK